jgi:phosphoglycolate phosphatase-like HAD superfamily hydrolase
MNDARQIFLDLDGPLLDGKAKHYYCYQSILMKYGFKPINVDKYWEMKRARVNRRELLSISGAEEIYDDFLASWLEIIESPEALAFDKVQEGAFDCLHDWKKRRIPVILVTRRKNKQALEEQLKRLELRSFLDAVLVCDHGGGSGKADAVRKMYPAQIYSENTLWIGDTEDDWEASISLGCKVVLLSNGLRNEEFLGSLEGALVRPSIVSVKDCISGG